jgi:hypothetical protein
MVKLRKKKKLGPLLKISLKCKNKKIKKLVTQFK